ncbi:MAG: hypothetical protein ACTS8H_04505 [Arsenophonus sp. NC-PE1-MAG3]
MKTKNRSDLTYTIDFSLTLINQQGKEIYTAEKISIANDTSK